MVTPVIDRLWEKTEVDDNGCWVFYEARLPHGYGQIRISNSKTERVHRVSWKIHCGKIPEGINVLHNCDNPPCWNPDHLWLGTQLENVHDCIDKNRFRTSVGDDNPKCILNEIKVFEIRRLLAETNLTQVQIADRFFVTPATISDIHNRRSWQHL